MRQLLRMAAAPLLLLCLFAAVGGAAASVRAQDAAAAQARTPLALIPDGNGAWYSACAVMSDEDDSDDDLDAAAVPVWPLTSAASAAAGVTNRWTDRAAPFALLSGRTLAERNPIYACAFSPSFRSAHSSDGLCAEHGDVLAAIDRSGEDGQVSAKPQPVPPPFASNVTFALRGGRDPSCQAYGWFTEELLSTGWNYLSVESNPEFSDEVQARAAGFLEGALTVNAMHEHKVNEFVSLFEPDSIGPDNRVQAFVNDMVAYQLQNVAQFAATDPYWAHVGLLLQQLQGIYEGYSAQNGKDDWALSFNDLVMLQLDGDMSDIQSKVWPSTRVDPTDPLSRILTHLIENSHCSALVKLTNSTDADIPQELFAAHDTWAGYSSTHRMYKAYNLSYSSVATTTLSFSSYPGYLTSTDDWLQTDETRLVVLETTNDSQWNHF